MAEKLVTMTTQLSALSKQLGESDGKTLEQRVRQIADVEESVDKMFEDAATQTMEVEFLNVNPDYLLDVAKHFDLMSDLIERCVLLFQYLNGFSNGDIFELLTTATVEINQIMLDCVHCISVLADDRSKTEELCEMISDRERVVDRIREQFNSLAVKMGVSEHRIWLKDIFSYLDQIGDLSRDLTITFRVIATKLERQRLLNVKNPRTV
jgi:uncharacterized protein Yka (UPF0111/DUF47 family)